MNTYQICTKECEAVHLCFFKGHGGLNQSNTSVLVRPSTGMDDWGKPCETKNKLVKFRHVEVSLWIDKWRILQIKYHVKCREQKISDENQVHYYGESISIWHSLLCRLIVVKIWKIKVKKLHLKMSYLVVLLAPINYWNKY